MWSEFIDSWSLFGDAYLAGMLAAATLAVCGVFLLLRNQVFLGAAASEMSALGVALSLWLGFHAPHTGDAHPHDHAHGPAGHAAAAAPLVDGPALAALLFAVAACLLAAAWPGRRQTREAVTGWMFLLGASLSLLVVSHAPLGQEEVEQALASTLLGARAGDVIVLCASLGVAIAALAFRFPSFLAFTTEPVFASACGIRVGRWTVGSYLVVGVAIGVAMHVAGFLYTFGCLLLPPMMAKALCRTVRGQLWVAPLLAVGCALLSFVAANHYDYPPAQFAVGLMAVFTPLASLLRRG